MIPVINLEKVCASLEALPVRSTQFQAVLEAVPNPNVRKTLGRLFSQWSQNHSSIGFTTLAWALRAAASMDQWWTDNRRLSAVWTGPAPAGGIFRRTDQAMLEVVEASQQELWLVCFAGYKLPAVRDALVAAADRDVAVRLIIESPEESQGKVAFSALEGLGGRLVDVATVYVWPWEKREKNAKGQHGSLHVKCALADGKVLFVTSANLTEFAMSLNMELGLLAQGGELPAQVARHFQWLIEHHYLIPTPRP